MEQHIAKSDVASKQSHDVARLLAEARSRRLMVFAQGGHLVVRGPRSADQEFVQMLLARKADLMPVVPALGPDEWERFEERAAIAEYDGGLTQVEAEWLAWNEIVRSGAQQFATP